MKRSELLQCKLTNPLDAIQVCRNVVEENFKAAFDASKALCDCGVDSVELQARIYTDLEILAMNQFERVLCGDMLQNCDPSDEDR